MAIPEQFFTAFISQFNNCFGFPTKLYNTLAGFEPGPSICDATAPRRHGRKRFVSRTGMTVSVNSSPGSPPAVLLHHVVVVAGQRQLVAVQPLESILRNRFGRNSQNWENVSL
jgi:hypothetical protein